MASPPPLSTETPPAALPASGAPEEEAPTVVGGFQVRGVLGEGGMGRVYRCFDEGLEREVAVKVLLESVAREPTMSERFLREARAMARLRSPHVVTVHQVGTDASGPYVVMELLDGEDLGSLLQREGKQSLARTKQILREAVLGLKAAAEAGLVHRDIKPENLFLTPEQLKLTDFGLARPVDGSGNLTSAGLIVGTPHYLAPEIARGAEATAQSDMYALGATLFELLTGRPPFTGSTAMEIISAHITSPAPDLAEVEPGVDARARKLCATLLSKEPGERPGNYDELLEALEQLGGPAPAATVEVSAPALVRPSFDLEKIKLYAAGAGLVVTMLAIAMLVFSGGDEGAARSGGGGKKAKVTVKKKVKKSSDDEDLEDWSEAELAAYLDEADIDDIKAELRERDDDDLVEALAERIDRGPWVARSNALKLLEEKGLATDKHRQTRAIRDLQHSSTCAARKSALKRLTRVAVDKKALTAVAGARTAGIKNICMATLWTSSRKKIEARIAK